MIIVGIVTLLILFLLGFLISCFLISEEGEDE
jgi:hypothetical protein